MATKLNTLGIPQLPSVQRRGFSSGNVLTDARRVSGLTTPSRVAIAKPAGGTNGVIDANAVGSMLKPTAPMVAARPAAGGGAIDPVTGAQQGTGGGGGLAGGSGTPITINVGTAPALAAGDYQFGNGLDLSLGDNPADRNVPAAGAENAAAAEAAAAEAAATPVIASQIPQEHMLGAEDFAGSPSTFAGIAERISAQAAAKLNTELADLRRTSAESEEQLRRGAGVEGLQGATVRSQLQRWREKSFSDMANTRAVSLANEIFSIAQAETEAVGQAFERVDSLISQLDEGNYSQIPSIIGNQLTMLYRTIYEASGLSPEEVNQQLAATMNGIAEDAFMGSLEAIASEHYGKSRSEIRRLIMNIPYPDGEKMTAAEADAWINAFLGVDYTEASASTSGTAGTESGRGSDRALGDRRTTTTRGG